MFNKTLNICQDQQIATAAGCPNFCGFCKPGASTQNHSTPISSVGPYVVTSPVTSSIQTITSTVATTPACKDKPTVDCKVWDTFYNICSDQKTAEASGCPKYCGFCP